MPKAWKRTTIRRWSQSEPNGCGGGAHGDGEVRDEDDERDREDEEINDRGAETEGEGSLARRGLGFRDGYRLVLGGDAGRSA
jgi:hypothetical protein